MGRFLSLLLGKALRAPAIDRERVHEEVAALAAQVQARARLLTPLIARARQSTKPDVLADLAAYDETLPAEWRGVATDAGLLASSAALGQAMRAQVAAKGAPSDDEMVRRRQRDVQQVIALFEGHAQPDPTPPIEAWHHEAADLIEDALVTVAHQRHAAAQGEPDAPRTMAEIEKMMQHTTAILQVASLVEGRPTPAGAPSPERRHREIAQEIRAIFARHDGPVTPPLSALDGAPNLDARPRRGPARDAPARDPAVRKIPHLVGAHVPPQRSVDTNDQDAVVRAVKAGLAFGRPYTKRQVVEAVGARCAARGLAPDRITLAQEAAGLVTAGFDTRSLARTAASLDTRGATPYQKAVGLASDVVVTMAKLHGVRPGPGFPQEMERKVAILTDDPAYYLELYALVAAVDSPTTPAWVALPPDEMGWRVDAASLIRDVVRTGRR